MKIPNWIRIILWIALIGFFSWLLSQRYDAITKGTSNATDIILFLIWIALIAAFIFQEVDFFGVKIKREIDNLKSEFKEQIINLRSDIQTINMKAEISPHITIGAPPTDSELPSIEERIRPILEQVLREQGVKRPVPEAEEFEVPDDTQLLFSVRYSIENELRRIWRNHRPEDMSDRPRSIIEIARNLNNLEIINADLISIIHDILAICNRVIHGEDISEAKTSFVRDVAPSLIASLGVIQ